MFRAPAKLMKAYRQRALSLIFVPVFLLSAIPHPACICADGHIEQFCTPGKCRACASRLAPKSKSHSCCAGTVTGEANSGCCHKESEPAHDESDLLKIASANACCCKAIMQIPAPVNAAKKTNVVSQSVIVANISPVMSLLGVEQLWPSFELDHAVIPRPFDAVIVYLHLTI